MQTREEIEKEIARLDIEIEGYTTQADEGTINDETYEYLDKALGWKSALQWVLK